MRGSRAERLFVAALLVLALGIGEAEAQTGGGQLSAPALPGVAVPSPSPSGPLRLTPRRMPGAPAPTSEEERETKEPSSPVRPAQGKQGEIVVEGLGSIDPDSVGTLEEDRGGLGLGMWNGTRRDLVERLLPRLPSDLPSPTLRDLERRLLLSAATAPVSSAAATNARKAGEKQRDGEGRTAASAHRSLLAMRIERLQAMGALDEATALIEIAPSRRQDPLLVRLRTDTMLLENDLGGACAEARRDPARLVKVYWQSLFVFCQALDGDLDGAALGANLLADTEEFDDPVFLALIDRMTGNKDASFDRLPNATPLHLAMMRAAKVEVPADALSSDSPVVLRTIAISPNAPLDLRLEAAERAAVAGALSAERLAEIYLSVSFTAEELDNALSTAESDRTPRGRALLYQAASIQSVPTARAAVLAKAFELAREDGRYDLAVRIYGPLLLNLPISGELVWFAAEAARALYALRRPLPAREWAALLRQQAARDAAARGAAEGLWVVARLAGDDRTAADEAGFEAWRERQYAQAPERAGRRVAFALALFEALGRPLDERYWRDLIGDLRRYTAVLPPSALRRALREAAANGRRGETVLLVLLMPGAEGLSGTSPELLAEMLRALVAVGLEEEAQALALEAAVSLGL